MGRTSDAKERLIAAMADLVHARGYLAVSVDDVCAAAGVRKGSFYYFFSSKRELMLAALDRRKAGIKEKLTPLQADESVPPFDRIAGLFASAASLEQRNKKDHGHARGCPFGNIAAEMSGTDPRLARAAREALAGLASFVSHALTEAKRRGEIPPDVDGPRAADAIVAYFEGLALLAKNRNEPELLRELGGPDIIRAVVMAIREPRPTRRPSRRSQDPARPRPTRGNVVKSSTTSKSKTSPTRSSGRPRSSR